MSDAIADVLDRAADLIEPEGRWTQGAYARSADGEPVMTLSPRAHCRCMSGAISFVGKSDGIVAEAKIFMLRRLNAQPAFDKLAWWNDAIGRTQTEVVSALRSAAADARKQPSPATQ